MAVVVSVGKTNPSRPEAHLDNGAPLHILILDDAETDRMRLKRLCKRSGLVAQFSEAATLDAFNEVLRASSPDVAFLDYALGEHTGLDALAALTGDPRHDDYIAIMVSSLDDLGLAIESMRKGCVDYVNKEELSVAAIRRSLALAFERKILLTSLREAEESERELRKVVSLLLQSCGGEIRSLLVAMVDQVQRSDSPNRPMDAEGLTVAIDRLDGLCRALSDSIPAPQGASEGEVQILGPRVVDLETR